MTPDRKTVETLIGILAPSFGVDIPLSIRQCEIESAFDQAAKSRCGALGLFQLMPGTAKGLGVDPTRWTENVFAGIKLMGQLLHQFEGDRAKAYAAYNWGSGRVTTAIAARGENWRMALPAETAGYLEKLGV